MSLSIQAENTFNNFIGGSWIPPAQASYLTLECEEGITRLPNSGADDIEHALLAAQRSSQAWLNLSVFRRLDCLVELGRLTEVYEESQRLCATQNRCANHWRAGGSEISKARYHLNNPQAAFVLSPCDPKDNQTITVGKLFFEPSTSINEAFRQIAPALASGYTLVAALLHQPHQQQCLQLMSFMEFAAHSLPPGVLNLVYGLGLEIGVPLIRSDLAVAFDSVSPIKQIDNGLSVKINIDNEYSQRI